MEVVGLGGVVARTVVGGVDRLRARPRRRIAAGEGKPGDQPRPPFALVAPVERPRVERPERVAADARLVLEDQAQVGLEGEVRPDVDPPERVGIVAVQRLPVGPVVAGLEADV